jgi:beta-lactamase regulating signal transducer with metallopeptidase domain
MTLLLSILLESSWRAGLAAAIVALALAATRARAAAVQHAVWSVVLGAMLLMPALPHLVPSLPVVVQTPAPHRTAITVVPESAPSTAPSANPPSDPMNVPEIPGASRTPWPVFCGSIYIVGLAVFLIRLFVGWRSARVILENSTGLGGNIYESPLISTPVTTGVLIPRIIRPVARRNWSGEKLRAVLAHEQAHVRRRDTLFASIAHLNRCLFWFHPLAWWLERKLAAAAEEICDDAGIGAIGDPRRYAEILLEQADAVRRSGGRFAGVGMDGSGHLSARIDRVLRADGLPRVSASRKAALGIACTLAIVVAAACRPQTKIVPLRDDPQEVAQRAHDKASQALAKSAIEMTANQVADLEAALARNPEDMTAREKLLLFYTAKSSIEARRNHILWLIAHHPESDLADSREARIFPSQLDPLPDPAGYEQGKKLWLTQAELPSATDPVLIHAAAFLKVADKPEAEKLLLRAQDSYDLGLLYYTVLMGSNASMPNGVVRSVNLADAHSPYANEIRRKLATSTDALLLETTGEQLAIWAPRLSDDHVIDFDARTLGVSYLERSLQLNPGPNRLSIRAHYALTFGHTPDLTPASIWHLGIHERYEAIQKLPESGRFFALSRTAEDAYYRGINTDYYRHDRPAAKVDWELAKKCARESLALAAQSRNDPQYGTAVFTDNMVLGMIAQYDGDRRAAIAYMLAASYAPQTDVLAYTSQGLTFQLPAWLLKDGERDSVVEFLERFAQVDIGEREELLRSATLIRQDKRPMWYRD